MKVHELAKELNIPSKEVINKAKNIGIELKSHMSTIIDEELDAVKKAVGGKGTSTETKIVKAKPKKSVEKEDVHVTTKATKVSAAGKSKKSATSKNESVKNTDDKRTPLQGSASNVPGKPKRVPAEQVIKRIPKEEREKEAKKDIEKTDNKDIAIVEKQKTEKKEKKAKPELKVAHKDKEELKPKKKTEDKKEERPDREKEELKKDKSVKDQKQSDKAEKTERTKPDKKKSVTKEAHSQKPIRKKSETSFKSASKTEKPKTGADAAKKGGKGKQKKKDAYRKNDEQRPSKKRSLKYEPISLEKKSSKPKSRPKQKQTVEEPEDKINLEELAPGTKVINVPITVAGLSEQMGKSTSDIIMTLMKLGIMANINQNIDEDTVLILAEELNIPIVIGKDAGAVIEEGIEMFEDKEEDLEKRPPIITVMGHVDHGKTSLLDAIRKTNVTEDEAGGITQHIGASEVTINDEKIVFLDTPGHEAFTAMRARGAHVTDIAVLVVAADDSVKPQTEESISHAKAAGVPVIVAINKIDKPGANIDKVKQDLADKGILVEDWGGDTISVPVSAKTGEGVVHLLEMILLQAEVLELKANPKRLAQGTVLEARLDKAKGPVTSLLVLNGTLDSGYSIVAGTTSGRIRAMIDDKGQSIKKAGPSTAVEILGLSDVPQAGDEFHAVKEDRIAREIAENRRLKQREEIMGGAQAGVTLESLFDQIKEGETKELNLIIKGDVQGSVGAITSALEKLKNENVNVRIIHTGVGTVTESDVTLAGTSGAIIIGFNVRPSNAVISRAEDEDVEIRTYRVIYDVIDDVEAAMKGMLDPEYKEVVLGTAEIRDIFKVPNIGVIGGAYVTSGKILRNAEIRLIRDGIVIHEGKISSLKRFKDDAREVAQGYECGIGIENYNDVKVGDTVEAYKMEEIER